MNLDQPLFQMSARDFFALERSVHFGTLLAQALVIAVVTWTVVRARAWWRARRRVPATLPRDLSYPHADLTPRPDWSAPCPVCGSIIDKDDADLYLGGLYVDGDSALGSAIRCGRPNPGPLEVRETGRSGPDLKPVPPAPDAA